MKLCEKVKRVISEPTRFFNAIKKEKDIGQAFIYYLIFLVISAIFSIFYYRRALLETPAANLVGGTMLTGMIIGQFVISLVCLFIVTGILHLFCRFMRGKGIYTDTFKAIVYGSTPSLIFSPVLMLYLGIVGIKNIFAVFPAYILMGVIAIWSLVLEIKGIKIAHSISTWKAVVAVIILPIALVIVIAIVIILIILALFATVVL